MTDARAASSRLYKYRSLRFEEDAQHVCDSIVGSRLYWASPLSFNDPFDCVPTYIYKGTKAEHLQNARRSVEVLGVGRPRGERRQMLAKGRRRKSGEIADTMAEASRKLLERMGVCSLTEARDDILMWSHYGDAHAGICLGFEPSLHAIDFAGAFPVLYARDRPQINLIRRSTGHELMEKVLLTKNSGWAYEREWRMIAQRLDSRSLRSRLEPL